MALWSNASAPRSRRSLARLARDTGGNTLAIMAAALVPMSALAGSAIDMSRLYVVKVRLQQSCDAGALAGRKFMTKDDFDADDEAKTQAKAFFNNNFKAGWFETTDVVFAPKATTDGQVEATATATVPMAVMFMFGKQPVKLETTCEARLEIADVDITFVLDTTGSMACLPEEASCSQTTVAYTREDGAEDFALTEKVGSRMDGLRSAVLEFYDTLKTSADPTTKVRYGFVPYASSVNIGHVLRNFNANYLVSDNWQYSSRVHVGDANDTSAGSTSTYTSPSPTSKAACESYNGRSPVYPQYTTTNGVSTATKTTMTWTASSAGSASGTCRADFQRVIPEYSYGVKTHDVSQFVKGVEVTDPTKVTGAKTRWIGCIEERNTEASSSFSATSPPSDLDIDTAPTSRATRWRPYWPAVSYRRNPNDAGDQTSTFNDQGTLDDASVNSSWLRWTGGRQEARRGASMCPKEAQRLKTMDRGDIEKYLNESEGFRAHGGTYHDFGMAWGARMASPTGIFAKDTEAWPNRTAPNRNIIFMTDGFIAPNMCSYGMHGVEALDRRVLGGSLKGCGTNSDQAPRHLARFSALCEAAKAKNITVWVVAFSSAVDMTSELRDCATPGRAFYAKNNADLQKEFKKIASQIAELRISK